MGLSHTCTLVCTPCNYTNLLERCVDSHWILYSLTELPHQDHRVEVVAVLTQQKCQIFSNSLFLEKRIEVKNRFDFTPHHLTTSDRNVTTDDVQD